MISGELDRITAVGQITQADLFSDATGNWPFDNPVPGGNGDDYAILGNGTLEVNTAGAFTFSLSGDDGGRLRIDTNQDEVLNELDDVIVDDDLHPFEDRIGEVALAVGTYKFEWIGLSAAAARVSNCPSRSAQVRYRP